MSDQLKNIVFALAAIVATLVLAKLLDLWLSHRKLPPEAVFDPQFLPPAAERQIK